MTELEKTQNLIEEFDKNYKDSFDAHSAIKYAMIYHQDALTQLLKVDLPKDQQEEKYIQSIINLASTKYCKKLVDELANKHIIINVEKINALLKTTKITKEAIICTNEDLTQSFYSTKTILSNLTYESDPLDAFARFLKRQHIEISLGNPEFRFCFTFLNDFTNGNQVKYYCNNFYELFKLCPHMMLEQCCNELIAFIATPLKALQTIPEECIDYKLLQNLNGIELYKYLHKFESIRINYNLEDLYLLLYFDEISLFQDNEVMDMVVQKIILGEM